MKSIGQLYFYNYKPIQNPLLRWEDLPSQDMSQCNVSARALIAHVTDIIRERAETDTNTWAARDEWLRVAALLEALE